jgi:hypothetical protein
MDAGFKIENVELGRKLVEIKNNKIIVDTPLVIVGTTVLSINQFLTGLASGILVNTSAGVASVTVPTAASIIAALGLVVGNQIQFTLGTLGSNTTTVLTNTGVTLVGVTTFAASNVRTCTLMCTSSTTVSIQV